MKTILKTCIIAFALLLTISANAQEKPITFGIKAGMNLSNMTEDLEADAKIGFNIGMTLDYAFTSNLYLLTGLDYSLEGSKEGDSKINLSYLKLPAHIGYKLPVTDNFKMIFHAGPYIAYAIDGKYKAGAVSIDAFNDDLVEVLGYKMKRFDFGLGLGVGAEFDKICVGVGYDLGLTDILDIKNSATIKEITGIGDPKGKNMNAYLTVGYKF
ncbi:PorT family protein [Dysgonomonas sp. Marseille-P4677]|uniref:porin family protein n=1 Tax=Dysgonomonas sp. Marseille-P4677 TaxID=2364790 RepID=UPI001911E845|nr:porin family protein [Dysgonomonas sp. Marseille-P4677]MBK5720757.1 PorT family protein [Dysgonomonas sp. Marseille-P4677]